MRAILDLLHNPRRWRRRLGKTLGKALARQAERLVVDLLHHHPGRFQFRCSACRALTEQTDRWATI
jgi:hypothetical protein